MIGVRLKKKKNNDKNVLVYSNVKCTLLFYHNIHVHSFKTTFPLKICFIRSVTYRNVKSNIRKVKLTLHVSGMIDLLTKIPYTSQFNWSYNPYNQYSI